MENFKKWIRNTCIRAIKAMANTAIVSIGTTLYVQNVKWNMVFAASILAGIISILHSIGSLPDNSTT